LLILQRGGKTNAAADLQVNVNGVIGGQGAAQESGGLRHEERPGGGWGEIAAGRAVPGELIGFL
jgi:hypothetical protein